MNIILIVIIFIIKSPLLSFAIVIVFITVRCYDTVLIVMVMDIIRVRVRIIHKDMDMVMDMIRVMARVIDKDMVRLRVNRLWVAI